MNNLKNRKNFTIKAKEEVVRVVRVLRELEQCLEPNCLSHPIESESFSCYFDISKDNYKNICEEGLISLTGEGVVLYFKNGELDFSEDYKIDDIFSCLYKLNFGDFVSSLDNVIDKYNKHVKKLNKEMKTEITLLKKLG